MLPFCSIGSQISTIYAHNVNNCNLVVSFIDVMKIMGRPRTLDSLKTVVFFIFYVNGKTNFFYNSTNGNLLFQQFISAHF